MNDSTVAKPEIVPRRQLNLQVGQLQLLEKVARAKSVLPFSRASRILDPQEKAALSWVYKKGRKSVATASCTTSKHSVTHAT